MFWNDLQEIRKKNDDSWTDRVGLKAKKKNFFATKGFFFQIAFSITKMAVLYKNLIKSVIPLVKNILNPF